MSNLYIVMLEDQETDSMKIVHLYGYCQLVTFITNYPAWKYKLTINEVDQICDIQNFIDDEGDQKFNGNPFSEN